MKYGILFSTLAALLAVFAVLNRGWYFLLLWPALSAAIVAGGYFYLGPAVYGKSSRGLLSPINLVLLLPYLLCMWSVWFAARLVKRERAWDQLTENVFIGRRLLSHELPDNIVHVIDLTCEFNEPKALRSLSYHSFQILDGAVTSPGQLRGWAEHVAGLKGDIYIHCAEGHGRTGLFAAVLLLCIGHSQSPEEALQFIKARRPLVRLGQRQMAVLHAIANGE